MAPDAKRFDHVRSIAAASALAASLWAGACMDEERLTEPGEGCTDCLPPDGPAGVRVSEPISPPSLAAPVAGPRALATDAIGAAYVSMSPGTVPNGSFAIVRRVGDADSVKTFVVDGGFDPVAVAAQVGDSIDIRITDATQQVILFQARLAVVAARAPIVVRTDPPPRKRDVPLNAAIVIVFSEPVTGSSLTSTSVRLLQGGAAIPGTVKFIDPSLDATQVIAEFVPDAPLAPQTEYELVVTSDVRDLSGETLLTPVTTAFTTGQSSTGPPDSIRLSIADTTVRLVTGATFQMTATVLDSAGNMLTGDPVTWSSADTNVFTVSPSGLLTARAQGFARLTAAVDGVSTGLGVLVEPGPPTSVSVTPTSASVPVFDTLFLTATVRDERGQTIATEPVQWTASPAGLVTLEPLAGIDPLGGRRARVIGVNEGAVGITATALSNGVRGDPASITVAPAVPVASITIAPDSATLVVGGIAQLSATLRDETGRIISGRPVDWTSLSTTVATVDVAGQVVADGAGVATIVAASGDVADSAYVSVIVLSFASLSGGTSYTCGVTTDGAAYCWGAPHNDALGVVGTPSQECKYTSTSPDSMGVTYVEPCLPVPHRVNGGLTFSVVDAAVVHTCGLTPSGVAYCWGGNYQAQFGNGPSSSSTQPSPVPSASGLILGTLNTGSSHTCGIASDDVAYCWGGNQYGQLGIGTAEDVNQGSPRTIQGGLTFRMVSTGGWHTCGVTTSGAAYCWGSNVYGTLGDGTTTTLQPSPVAVLGGLTFASISASFNHTCGVTTTGEAYCWGYNGGRLGDGTTTDRTSPVPVLGGLTFAMVSAGGGHTCGVTTSGAAHCWGYNGDGRLGDGTVADRTSPVAVLGGLTFSSISTGDAHTCGITTQNVAYCWGRNHSGQLGNGTANSTALPVKVAGQP